MRDYGHLQSVPRALLQWQPGGPAMGENENFQRIPNDLQLCWLGLEPQAPPPQQIAAHDNMPVAARINEQVSVVELGYLGRLRTREQLRAIKEEFNRRAQDPTFVLTREMRENRVLGMGEFHAENSPHREFGRTLLPRLQAAGATHLAVELPVTAQPAINEFMRTGRLDRSVLPFFVDHDNYVDLLTAARDAGLQIRCVDIRDGQDRDQHMADRIVDILNQDSNNKVVFWVGAFHLRRRGGTAADLIRQRGFRMATVIDKSDLERFDPLAALTSDLRSPVALTMQQTPLIRQLPDNFLVGSTANAAYYDEWDIVLAYPHAGRNGDAPPPTRPAIVAPLLTAEVGATVMGFLNGARYNVAGLITGEPLVARRGLRSAGIGVGAAALTFCGNYALDRFLSQYDQGDHWYSMRPTREEPYYSTIFRPTVTESIGIATVSSLPIDLRYRVALAAGVWLLGRAQNFAQQR